MGAAFQEIVKNYFLLQEFQLVLSESVKHFVEISPIVENSMMFGKMQRNLVKWREIKRNVDEFREIQRVRDV